MNFLGAAILNNCDLSWLPYCFRTNALCVRTIGQPRHVTIIQDGGTQEIWKPKQAFFKFIIFGYKRFHWREFEQLLIVNLMFWGLKFFCCFSGGSNDAKYQNPSGFACLMLIRAIAIFTPLGGGGGEGWGTTFK